MQTINQLLTEMDGFENNKGVVFIAATNRPGVLDDAVVRPGRFDRIIHLSHPNLDVSPALLLAWHSLCWPSITCNCAPKADGHTCGRASSSAQQVQCSTSHDV